MVELKDLIERVEKATGPDRALSREVGRYFGRLGHYTASVDAVLALVEEKLPGWAFGSLVRAYAAGVDPSPHYAVLVRVGNDGAFSGRVEALGETKATALLLALLRSLNQSEGKS